MAAPLARLSVAAGRHTLVSTDRLATRLASTSNLRSIGPLAVRRWMSNDFAGRDATAEALKAEEEAKTAAEVTRKNKAEVDADVVAANNKWWREMIWMRLRLAALVGTAYLAWDHYTHTNPYYLRKQMREAILKGLPDDSLPSQPTHSLSVRPLYITSPVPVVVMGPSGSGKSTLLANYARELKKDGVPVVYFRLRGNDNSSDVVRRNSGQSLLAASSVTPQPAGSTTSPPTAAAEFSMVSERFFRAVGYPVRPSWWSLLWVNIHKLLAREVDLELPPPLVESRFTEAVTDMFVVCSELAKERNLNNQIPLDRKTPVIFADELDDLLSEGVADIGGAEVFRWFTNFMINYQVYADAGGVRVFLTGSRPDLRIRLSHNTKAYGPRLDGFSTTDPTPDEVLKCLRDLGYPEAEARQILKECGTRLRILTRFVEVERKDGNIYSLESGGLVDVPALLADVADEAESDIANLFQQTSPLGDVREQLVKFLDRLAATSGASPVHGELPKPLTPTHVNKVIFRNKCFDHYFQNEAYRLAWPRVRENYLRKP